MKNEPLKGIELFGKEVYIEEYDLYYVVYANGKIPLEIRKKLKLIGWNLQRHSRTNEEIWIFDKI